MENSFQFANQLATWAKSLARPNKHCGALNCAGAKSLWPRVWASRHGIRFDGVLYCHAQCLEAAVRQELIGLQDQVPAPPPANRMPLGLLMVARGKLTYDQVLRALAAQRAAGSGNIGEWFERLGFLSEHEVVAALGLQWGCPVSATLDLNATSHQLPLALLESFQMWPVHYVAATHTQYIAFGKRVDHAALYAMEKMLGCRVQACVAPSKVIASRIEGLRLKARSGEVEFRSMHDCAEIVRIAISYITRLDAQEIRMSRVGDFIWLLLTKCETTMNLLFRLKDTRPVAEGPEAHVAASADVIPDSSPRLWRDEALLPHPTVAT